MSVTISRASTRHSVVKCYNGVDFRIMWAVPYKQGRLRELASHQRDTDKKGAIRFAKKHGITHFMDMSDGRKHYPIDELCQ